MNEQLLLDIRRKTKIKKYPLSDTYMGPSFHLFVKKRHERYSIVQALIPQTLQGHSINTQTNTAKVHVKEHAQDKGFFVAYPTNVLHSQLFAHSDTRGGGPSYYFPGSAAVMKYSVSNANIFHFEYLQFSFRQGSPINLTRSIASKYQGARNLLIQTALEYMDEIGSTQVFRGHQIHRSRNNHATIDAKLREERFEHIKEFELPPAYHVAMMLSDED